MSTFIFVENLKDSKAAAQIIKKLENISEISNINIDVSKEKISFNCKSDLCKQVVIKQLKTLGYAQKNIKNRQNLMGD